MTAGPIDVDQVNALMRVEMRRNRGPMLKMLAMIGVVVAISLATAGARNTGFLSGLLSAVFLGLPALSAMHLMRDRVEGTVEFLCALPATGATLAASRFATIGLIGVVTAVLNGVGALISGLPEQLGAAPWAVALAATLLGWAVPVTIGGIAAALGARFRMETVMTAVMVGIFALALVGDAAAPRVARLFAVPGVVTFLQQSWAPPLIIALVLLACVAVLLFTFDFTARAMRDFRPQPDKV